MATEHQEGAWTQLRFFEAEEGSVRHGVSSEGGTGTAAHEEGQAATAWSRERALTSNLMEKVCERENLNRAYKRVRANKGAPGIDGKTVEELNGWIKENKEELIASLLDGSYEPREVKGVKIPKASGVHNPAHADHRFRWMPSTRSEPCRPPVPTACRPLFRPLRNGWTTSFGFSGRHARNPDSIRIG